MQSIHLVAGLVMFRIRVEMPLYDLPHKKRSRTLCCGSFRIQTGKHLIRQV